MNKPKFFDKPRDCKRRLSDLNLDRNLLIDVVKQAVASRAGVTDNDPVSASGYEFWRGGTRRLRELTLKRGYHNCRPNGVESISDPVRKIRVSIMATDENTAHQDLIPKNQTPKGPGTESVIDANRQLLLPFPNIEQPQSTENDGYTHWLLCIHDGGEDVCAELSCPTEFSGGKFTSFVERIVIIGPGEWNGIDPLQDVNDDLGPEIEISVQRKLQ